MTWLLTAIICVAGVCQPKQTEYATHAACMRAERAVKGHGITDHCHRQAQMGNCSSPPA